MWSNSEKGTKCNLEESIIQERFEIKEINRPKKLVEPLSRFIVAR